MSECPDRGYGFAATHDRSRPDEWRVETYGEDGVTYQIATFTGTMSEERAMAYLNWLERGPGCSSSQGDRLTPEERGWIEAATGLKDRITAASHMMHAAYIAQLLQIIDRLAPRPS